jgi:hypothetical protein
MEQLTFDSLIDPGPENRVCIHWDPQAMEELHHAMAAAILAVFQGAEKNEEPDLSA